MKKNGFQRTAATIALLGLALILVFAGCQEDPGRKEPEQKNNPKVTGIILERPVRPGLAYVGRGGDLTYNITVEAENMTSVNLAGNDVVFGYVPVGSTDIIPVQGITVSGEVQVGSKQSFTIHIDDSFTEAEYYVMEMSIKGVKSDNSVHVFISPETPVDSITIVPASDPGEAIAGQESTLNYMVTVVGDGAIFPIDIVEHIGLERQDGLELTGVTLNDGEIAVTRTAVPLSLKVTWPAGMPETVALIAVLYEVESAPFDMVIKPAPLTGKATIHDDDEQPNWLTVNTDDLPGLGNLTFQWQRSNTADGTYVNIQSEPVPGRGYNVIEADWEKWLQVLVFRVGFTGHVIAGPLYIYDPRAPEITGTVTVTGKAEVGEKLTAAATVTNPSYGTVNYGWEFSVDNGETFNVISEATANEYTVKPSDIGSKIRAAVSAQGTREHIYSTPTNTILPVLSGTVTVTGTPQIGHYLSANVTGLSEGTGALTYQWQRSTASGFEVISGNTNFDYYVAVDDDEGKKLRVRVTRAGHSGEVISAWTADVFRYPPLEGTVTITGETYVGWTLTADISALQGAGTPSFVWQRGTTPISGATNFTYVLQTADQGQTIRVVVSRAGFAGEKISSPTAAVQATPALTGTVTIIGEAETRVRLEADISALGGIATIAPVYEWQRKTTVVSGGGEEPGEGEGEDPPEGRIAEEAEFEPIANATNSFYVVSNNDVDYVIRVKVTRPGYTGEVYSAPTEKVTLYVPPTVLQQLTTLRARDPVPETYSIIASSASEALAPQALTFTTPITITLSGSPGDALTTSANGALFTVNANVTLVLESIELVGRSGNNNSVVRVNGGNVVMNAGTVIRGNTTTTANTGGGVYVQTGTFTMNGGTIGGSTANRNTATTGGGVRNNGTFTMNGGTISYNTVSGTNSGGGVWNNATFNMTGGTISSNSSGGNGAGVFNNTASATFTMTGGTISSNTATGTNGAGAGVYNSLGTVNFNDGLISDNTAAAAGGGIYTIGGTVNMRGGTISGNKATSSDGGGVMVTRSSASVAGNFNMYGGTIHGNTSGRIGGGVVCQYNNGYFNMHNGIISGNSAVYGGGVATFSGCFRIMNGTIYGTDAVDTSLINTSTSGAAAFEGGYIVSGGPNNIAQRGVFNGTAWTVMGSILTSNTTFTIQSGVNLMNPTGLKVTAIDSKYEGKEGRIFLSNNAGVSWTQLDGSETEIQIPDTTFTWPTWDISVANWLLKLEIYDGSALVIALSGTIPLGPGISTTPFTSFTEMAPPTTVTAITLTNIPAINNMYDIYIFALVGTDPENEDDWELMGYLDNYPAIGPNGTRTFSPLITMNPGSWYLDVYIVHYETFNIAAGLEVVNLPLVAGPNTVSWNQFSIYGGAIPNVAPPSVNSLPNNLQTFKSKLSSTKLLSENLGRRSSRPESRILLKDQQILPVQSLPAR